MSLCDINLKKLLSLKEAKNSTQRGLKEALLDPNYFEKNLKKNGNGYGVSLKYFTTIPIENNCFSKLDRASLRNFTKFCEEIRKCSKVEEINSKYVPKNLDNLDGLSRVMKNLLENTGYKKVQIIHYRIGRKSRVHGFWNDKFFNVLLIDPEHHLHPKDNN